MNSFHWSLTLGLQAGYHRRQQYAPTLSQVGQIYQGIAEELYHETDVYISASIHPMRTLYRAEWGCPEGGEETVLLTGCCNPAFASPEKYRAVLEQLAKRLKSYFRQETVMLEIMPTEAIYMAESEEERT